MQQKKQTKHTPEPAIEYAETPELKAAIAAVYEALARRRTLDEAIAEAPAKIASLEREIQQLRVDLARKEADIIWVPESEVAALEKDIQKVDDELNAKELNLRRANARIAALEARAPEIDAAVDRAGKALNLEAQMVASNFKALIAQELRDAVNPILDILAKARSVGFGQFTDFFRAAYLPDPEGFMYLGGTNTDNVGVNLLAESHLHGPNVVSDALAPARAAMAAARAYSPYVPLAKRPMPYVIKGSNEGPARGAGGPIGKPSAPPQAIESKPFPGYQTGQPYEVKGDSRGVRTQRGAAPQELNIGAAIMANAESAEQ